MRTLSLIPLGMATMLTLTPVSAPAHQSRIEGAVTATLAGSAVFGTVQGRSSFSLELGAYSENGAVVFSRVNGQRPAVGTYEVTPFGPGTEGADAFHAMISLGSAEAPVGAFRATSGTVTITQSSDTRITGRYEVRAVGFLAADMDNEDRQITVRGSFTAERAGERSQFSAALSGAVTSQMTGAAEFGEVGQDADRAFTLTMGAASEQGALVLSRSRSGRPAVGTYPVREGGERRGEFHGLVIAGSPSRPEGVFRVRRGTVTITSSTPDRITGTFELHAVGFLASSIEDEGREVTLSGSFVAMAGQVPATLSLR